MKKSTLMLLIGFILISIAAIFAIIFGFIEGETGGLITTNYDVYLGIELGVSLPIFFAGLILIIVGAVKKHHESILSLSNPPPSLDLVDNTSSSD